MFDILFYYPVYVCEILIHLSFPVEFGFSVFGGPFSFTKNGKIQLGENGNVMDGPGLI
jgi:hypothetical protein